MIKSSEFQRRGFRLPKVAMVVLSALVAGGALAANGALTAATSEKMVAACFAYARAHRGAVNIWVYDSNGEVLRFERMDGAPAIGSPPETLPPRNGLTPFGAVIDPNAATPGDQGDIPVRDGKETVGRVRVAGMGPAGDHACAEAAVEGR